MCYSFLVAWGPVQFVLADGESLIVQGDDVRRVYDALCELCVQPGALSTADLLAKTSRFPEARPAIDLTAPQSTVLRKAVALVHAAA